jgi:hypothetical protein
MTLRFPVEAGHIMMFARAIGDANPRYYEETAGSEGVVAPPTFVQASAQFDPDYPLRPKIGQPWFGSGRDPAGPRPSFAGGRRGGAGGGGASGGGGSGGGGGGGGGGGTGLHAEQHFEYARPVRPGDVLTWTTRPGKTWEKQGRRGGRLVFSELVTEYRDQQGALVVTARSVGVRTEKTVEEDT